MEDLIKALQILNKYASPERPTHCDNDVLFVNISPKIVSEEDKQELDNLGFIAEYELDLFKSFRYGSF